MSVSQLLSVILDSESDCDPRNASDTDPDSDASQTDKVGKADIKL